MTQLSEQHIKDLLAGINDPNSDSDIISLGWLRGVHPTFGRVPSGALWIMNSVGLNIFIAIVGISSGPTFIDGLRDVGVGVFFWGVAVTSAAPRARTSGASPSPRFPCCSLR